MPRFFFRIHDSVDIEDTEGILLPDLDAALEEATQSARELLASGDRIGRDRRHWWIVVLDESEAEMAKVLFSDTLKRDNAS